MKEVKRLRQSWQRPGVGWGAGVGVWAGLVPAVALASGGEVGGWPWYVHFGGAAFNLLLLVALLVYFAGPRIKRGLRQRQESAERAMQEAAEMRAKAEAMLDEVSAQLALVATRREEVMAESQAIGEREAARIIASAERMAARIVEDARVSAERENVRLRQHLEAELVAMVMAKAVAVIQGRLATDPVVQRRLVDEALLAMAESDEGEVRPKGVTRGGQGDEV